MCMPCTPTVLLLVRTVLLQCSDDRCEALNQCLQCNGEKTACEPKPEGELCGAHGRCDGEANPTCKVSCNEQCTRSWPAGRVPGPPKYGPVSSRAHASTRVVR
jgi:hypothetical protein